MNEPEDRIPGSTVTISMLISERTYRLITLIDRGIRWTEKTTRTHRFLARILLG